MNVKAPATASTVPGCGRTSKEFDMGYGTCSIDGCAKPHYARGWCRTHYSRWQRNGDPLLLRRTPQGSVCSVGNCQDEPHSKGMCSSHYKRRMRHGDPTAGRLSGSLETLFWAKVDKHGPVHSRLGTRCWIWTASKSFGYGQFQAKRAHRLSYQLLKGSIPDDLPLDHLCHNRECVNPDHLRPATYKENNENRGVLNKNNTSGVRGVSWDKARGLWFAKVTHNRGQYPLGRFKSFADAVEAVRLKRIELFTHNDLDRA